MKVAGNAFAWRAVQMAGVKVVFMIRLLVLARLLSPLDFGLLAIAVTVLGFFLNATDFGMIPALVQRESVDDSHYDAAWTVGVARALTVCTIVVLTAPLIAQIFKEQQAVTIIRILAFRPFLDSLASIKVARLNRELKFRPLAAIKLTESLANAVVSISLARPLGVWALVAGTLAGSLASLLASYQLAPHRPRLVFDRIAIRPLIQFGRWIFLTSLVIMAGNYLLRLTISRQLGTEQLGLYYLAFQLAFLPAEVAGEVVGTVAFPLFSRLQNNKPRIIRAFRIVLTGISTFLLPACALIIALAPAFVQYVLGDRWAGTESIIRILALAGMIGLLGDVIVPILKGLGQPQHITVIELVQSACLILFAWLLTGRYGLTGAALSWLPAMIVSMFIGLLYVRRILYRPFAGLFMPMFAITLAAGTGAIVSLVIVDFSPGLGGLVVAGIIAVVVTFIFLFTADQRFSLGLAQDAIQVFPQIGRFVKYQPADKTRQLP